MVPDVISSGSRTGQSIVCASGCFFSCRLTDLASDAFALMAFSLSTNIPSDQFAVTNEHSVLRVLVLNPHSLVVM